MVKKVLKNNWLKLKPYDVEVSTDVYYIKICNDIKKVLTKKHGKIGLHEFLNDEEFEELACFLTSFFEDIVSETNIWNTFIKMHKEIYDKPLPFFSMDGYIEGVINHQDINFLMWYFLSTLNFELPVDSHNPIIVEKVDLIKKVFDIAKKKAPKNKNLKSYYYINENEDDFYKVRKLKEDIFFKTYLFYYDIASYIKMEIMKILNEVEDKELREEDEVIMDMITDKKDKIINSKRTRLLALTGKEWTANLLGKNHGLYNDLLNISQRVEGVFYYKGQDEENVFIEHLSSGLKFNITKKSFDDYDSLNETDQMIYISFIKWKDEWWFSGVYFTMPYDENLIEELKNTDDKFKLLRLFNDYEDVDEENIQLLLSKFKEFNDGYQIAFLPSNRIDEFIKEFYKFYNESLIAENRQIPDDFDIDNLLELDFSISKTSNNENFKALVFFNPKSGIEITSYLNSAFPMPNNPYYDENEAAGDFLLLLINDFISPELVRFCVDNCADRMEFLKEDAWKVVIDNLDFLLRFWKNDNYYTDPHINYL